MFLPNKYTNWYLTLINNANEREYNPSIHEKHHILPRCMGGSNRKENLAILTFREHYIAHLLLTKMVTSDFKRRMSYALWNMVNVDNKGKRTYRSKLYSQIRENYLKINSGWKHKPESIAKMKANPNIKQPHYGEENGMFEGYYMTPWGKYSTAQQAVNACPYSVCDRKNLIRMCKKNLNKMIRRPCTDVPLEWRGKTYQEIGFAFERKQ